MAPGGFEILVSDGYIRRLVRLTCGPFRYIRYSECNLDAAMRYAAELCLIQLQQKS